MSIQVKFEVGKEYMCGDNKVKAVYVLEENGIDNPGIVCVMLHNFGSYCCCGMAGVFDSYDGEYSCHNQPEMQHDLTELPKEIEELTLEQVCKELGIEIKVIKGDSLYG